MISVTVDNKKTIAALTDLQKNQFPFAFALTLTRLAQASQGLIRKEMPKHFSVRSKRVINGVQIVPAKKKDKVPTSHVIDVDSFMENQVFGGIKKPSKSKKIAIPKLDLLKKGARTKSGSIKKGMKPGDYLKKIDELKGKRKLRNKAYAFSNPFMIRFRSGKSAIVQRVEPSRKVFKFLYQFQDKAEIKKRWPFSETVQRQVEKHYFTIFERSMKYALKTAK